MSARLSNRRIRLLVAFFALVFTVALARAAWLQAVRGPELEKLAANQQRETIVLPARRGTIFDRMGVELAIGEEAMTVYANPTEITRPRVVAAAVAEDLGLDESEVLASISDRSKTFVYVQRKANPDRRRRSQRRELPGLGFYPEERRVYPQTRTAASVVGYAGIDNEGLAGIELQYDDALTGQNGEETIVRDPFGTALDVIESKRVEQGKDVFLTIDSRLQARVEEILEETLEIWAAEAVTAVVIDTRSGGVLALGQAPGFDANLFPDVPAEQFRTRAVTDTYEPGSTFKVVTAAAAIDDGMVTPASSFTLPAELEVADRIIHEAEERDTETMTVTEILSRSSNVGAVMLALNLGKERLALVDRSLRFRPSCRHRLSGGERRHRAPSPSDGPARRSATSRSARALPSHRCRWRPCTPRLRTAVSGFGRISPSASATSACRSQTGSASSNVRPRAS